VPARAGVPETSAEPRRVARWLPIKKISSKVADRGNDLRH